MKDNRGGSVGQPMSKQSFMMWAGGGAAFFIIAVVMFMTLIVGRMNRAAEAKKRAEETKNAIQDLQRVMREDPNNFDSMDEALQKLKEVSKGTKFGPDVEELEKQIVRRKADFKLKKAATDNLGQIVTMLTQPGGGDQALAKIREVEKSLATVTWNEQLKEKDAHYSQLVRILKAARELAEKGKTAPTPDWDSIAGWYGVVGELVKTVPPEFYPASEAGTVLKDIDEAIEKRYDNPAFLDRLPWNDMLGSDTAWQKDSWLNVSKSGADLVLEYPAGGTEKAGLYWMNEVKTWKDYIVQIEFTVEGAGFQILERTQPGQQPGATHDLELMVNQQILKSGEKATISLKVYGGRFVTQVGETKTRPAFCPPTAAKTGGVTIRVPSGVKLTIHKMQVKVMMSED